MFVLMPFQLTCEVVLVIQNEEIKRNIQIVQEALENKFKTARSELRQVQAESPPLTITGLL